MTSCRFHKAARDGLLDVLKEATRKDANVKDDDSMTPVLWAAFEGRLDALRLLCGRGGDPDKCDQFGNTALHLASAKGHLPCVDFLVKFGVNIYALDIDRHSAKDLAAINNKDDILHYLDAATANFEANDRKKAKILRDIAEKNCEKRMRDYMKRQTKLENDSNDSNLPSTIGNQRSSISSSRNKSNMLSTIKNKIWSSQSNLNRSVKENGSSVPAGGAKFSELVGASSTSSVGSVASRGGTFKKKYQIENQNNSNNFDDTGFKIGEVEPDGTRTITSLTGVQRDSEVLYVGTFSSNDENGKRGKISDVFEVDGKNQLDRDYSGLGYGTLSRSFSQPDFLADGNTIESSRIGGELTTQRSTGIFQRPVLGSIAFRRSVSAALSQLQPESCSLDLDSSMPCETALSRKNNSIIKTRNTKTRSFLNISDTDSDGADGDSDDDHDDAGSPIHRFLAAWGLGEYFTVFQKQQIDLDTLMLLTEADLKTLGLPLGPFRKLTCAIQERRNALSNPGTMQDSRL